MTESSRKEFIAELKDKLDEADERIDTLERKFEEASGDARQEYRKRLDELREQRERAGRKLQELRDAGDDSWQGIKDEAEQVGKALRNSFNYFKSHFRD
ncbi:hypothetical protein HFP89_15695 [Wenzhouxiangella sp. XN79A]|uniref:hypothetical protein n=1 Tax=Wenzhouxiangella sp. XN79A TaxID=2724193 RepID=UPI00144A8D77|nr:hypothetical protein [Wenzhouxiangella sp. XN79A]NKI36615.1 hypothetical protein [Wenzhouxiangella sp. XN79A]